jgi:hypothetical protein
MGLMNKKTAIFLVVCQFVFIVLFGVFVDYGEEADARAVQNSRNLDKNGTNHDDNSVKHFYPSESLVADFCSLAGIALFNRKHGRHIRE